MRYVLRSLLLVVNWQGWIVCVFIIMRVLRSGIENWGVRGVQCMGKIRGQRENEREKEKERKRKRARVNWRG